MSEEGARPSELLAEINEAFQAEDPAIVDCVVTADEMPNFPHPELDKIGHYAVAKIKEAGSHGYRALTEDGPSRHGGGHVPSQPVPARGN